MVAGQTGQGAEWFEPSILPMCCIVMEPSYYGSCVKRCWDRVGLGFDGCPSCGGFPYPSIGLRDQSQFHRGSDEKSPPFTCHHQMGHIVACMSTEGASFPELTTKMELWPAGRRCCVVGFRVQPWVLRVIPLGKERFWHPASLLCSGSS